MTLLSELTCPWPIDFEGCTDLESDPEDPLYIHAVATASSIMTRLSGYTVGLCEAKLRPLRLCPVCRTWCCGGTDGIYLVGPFNLNVWDVTRVRLGATEYAGESWTFDRESRMLYRVPPDTWPLRDEKWSAPGEGGAFVVDALIGTPPDSWALDVAGRLVKELILSCTTGKCRLPVNTTSVTAAGVTVHLRDEEVWTLIPELRAWVHAVNPHNARLPGAVFSPDIAPSRLNGSRCCHG